MRIYRKWIILLVLGFTGITLKAQPPKWLYDSSYDTSYVKRFPGISSVRLYTTSKYYQFTMSQNSRQTTQVFLPNTNWSLGLGFSKNNFALDLGISAWPATSPDSLDRSRSGALLGTLYTNQHVFDICVQYYKGFVSQEKKKGDDVPYVFKNELHTFNLGINYNYVFNYKRFSSSGPFVGTQIQKKSAGTFLAGAYIQFYILGADNPIIDSSDALNSYAEITEASVYTAGFMGGYAYTFALPANFFISLCLVPGIGINTGATKSEGTYHRVGDLATLSWKVVTKNAVGYSGNQFYVYASYNLEVNHMGLQMDNSINYELQKIKAVFGYRFKSLRYRKGLPGSKDDS